MFPLARLRQVRRVIFVPIRPSAASCRRGQQPLFVATGLRRAFTTKNDGPEKEKAPALPAEQSIADTATTTTGPGAQGGEKPADSEEAGSKKLKISALNGTWYDAALSAVVGLSMVFVGGMIYITWYKQNVLRKIEKSFEKGYDPALTLAEKARDRVPIPGDDNEQIRRAEQDMVDRIIGGKETGRYFMILGPKGSGKSTMIYEAMMQIQADGVSVVEAHPDLEVFRLRLGKALNYEFFEDSQTGLFQRRDPREGGPGLDIERALNTLEKVALKISQKRKRPLVLVFNNVHFFPHDAAGENILVQLQQRAEAWSESGILTMVFSADDFWPFHIMRRNASRMKVVSIKDLGPKEAETAARRLRSGGDHPPEDSDIYRQALAYVGGRLSFLHKITSAPSMVDEAKQLFEHEKGWLLGQIGLIPDCDDDVMDEQKWSSCAWLLLAEFVKIYQELEKNCAPGSDELLTLPVIPYWKCRQIMTRADFIEELDHQNIIQIDTEHNVRPDSMVILRAARSVVEEEGFEELLTNVRNRIDDIESLHRTRELTFKDIQPGDRVRLSVDKFSDRFNVSDD